MYSIIVPQIIRIKMFPRGGKFKTDLQAHGGKAEQVVNFSADLWAPYRESIKENFANAALTLDRYQLAKAEKCPF
jgi:transposase